MSGSLWFLRSENGDSVQNEEVWNPLGPMRAS